MFAMHEVFDLTEFRQWFSARSEGVKMPSLRISFWG